MTPRRALVLAALLAGCSQTTAVDITLALVGSAAGHGADARVLDLAVDGEAQPFAKTIDVTGKLASDKATLEYRPKISSGTLTFTVTLSDGAGNVLGTGSASATVRAHSAVPLTISIGDEGGDLAMPPDLGDCVNGDGVCPADCNANSDNDCPAVCGNHIVEPGETCDDGNSANGDACDPTCHYANTLSIVSGHAGSAGFADGIGEQARFNLPNGMTSDGTYLYVTDIDVIRRVDPTTGQVITLAGKIGEETRIDGPGATARFREPFDLTWDSGQNKLYVIDNYDNNLRSIDLASPTFTVATLNSTNLASPVSVVFTGSTIDVLDSGGITSYSTAGAKISTLVTVAQLQSAGGSFPLFGLGYNGNIPGYVVSMGSKIFTVTNTGTIALLAGTTSAGCVDGAAGTGTMKGANRLNVSGTTFYSVDSACELVRTFTGGTLSTYAGNGTFGDGSIPPAVDLKHIGFRTADALAFVNGVLYVLEEDGGRVRKVTPTDTSVLAGSGPFVSSVDKVVYGGATTSRFGGLATGATIATDGQNAWAIGSNGDLVQIALADGSSQTFTNVPGAAGLTRIGTTLYIAANNNVLTWDTATKMLGPNYVTGGVTGSYLTNDGTNLYWLDGQVVKKLDANKAISVVAGTAGTTMVVDGTGVAASFAFAQNLACDGKHLFVLDSAVRSQRLVLRQIDLASQVVTTIAGKVGVAGTADGVGTNALFAGASGLATDGVSVFIGDAGESANYGDFNGPTIRQMVLATGEVTTMIGTRGQWTAAPGIGTAAHVDQPMALTIDIPSHTILFYDGIENVFERIK